MRAWPWLLRRRALCWAAAAEQQQQRPPVLDRRAVLKALAEARRRGASVEEAMSRFKGRLSSSLIGRVVHEVGSMETAREFFCWAGQQPHFRHSAHSYTCFLDALVKAKQLDRAVDFFRDELCKNCLPTRVSYTVLLQGFCKRGDVRTAMQIFYAMKNSGVSPDVNTYNILLKGLCDKGLVGRAMLRFGIMVRRCKPDLITYNTMIKGLCRHGRVDWAIFIFQRMTATEDITFTRQGDRSIVKASFLFTALPHELVEPDGYTYSSLIHGLCKDERFDEAVVVFDRMLARGFKPDAAVFNTMANGLIMGGRFKDAVGVVKRMVELGFKPDVVTYSIVIAGSCRKGRVKEAYRLFQTMLGSDCPPNLITFNSMMWGLARLGRVAECEALLALMRKNRLRPDQYTYNNMMLALVKTRQPDKAKMVFQAALGEHLWPDVHMYTTLVKGYSRAGRLDEALFVFEDMKRRCTPNVRAYNLLLQGLCANPSTFDESLRLFDDMIRLGCWPNRWTFQLMLAGMVKSGQTDKFYHVFMNMVYKGRFAKSGPLLEPGSRVDALFGMKLRQTEQEVPYTKELYDKRPSSLFSVNASSIEQPSVGS